MAPDLHIAASRVRCGKSGIDGPGAVMLRDGRITSVRLADRLDVQRRDIEKPDQRGAQLIRLDDAVLLPGLVDLHCHVGGLGFGAGIDPERDLLRAGTTTAASQGDAGAANVDAWVAEVGEATRARILLAIYIGLHGDSETETPLTGAASLDVPGCAAAVERHREVVWAVAVNTSRRSCGELDPRFVLRAGLAVAEQCDLPILYGPRQPEDWPLSEQFDLLRPGDVVTYCFRGQPYSLLGPNNRMRAEVDEARVRGVLFDVGHGVTAFDKDIAQRCLALGWYPDTISSDLQAAYPREGATHSVALTAGLLVSLGMPEGLALDAITFRPAAAMARTDVVGTLALGAPADLTALSVRDGAWSPVLVIKAGEIVLNGLS